MSGPLAGFICALIVAVFVIAWIAYCMFCREHHKSELYQYDVSDLRHRNYVLSLEQEENQSKEEVKKETAVGIFILPSRRKQKDEEYSKRPDYPESPIPVLETGVDNLVEIFNDSAVDAEVHSKGGLYEIDSNSQYHSDV